MVAAVRAGLPMRAVARQFRVSLLTVQRWVQRAGGRRLDRVDWRDRPHTPHRIRRTAPEVEERVLRLRSTLRDTSDLGEFGAVAIRQALLERGGSRVPAVRTIGRILERRGALEGRRRVRRPPPPLGWYLPAVVAARVELNSFDIIDGLVIAGGTDVEVLTGLSLHGGLPAAWPSPPLRAATIVELLLENWRACGVPVFTPPRETGFQAAVESYNGRWQAKVWARFHHRTLPMLQTRSARYVAALRARRAARIEAAPARRPFPALWRWDLQARPRGCMVFLRRTTDLGAVELLRHRWRVDRSWPHRLIRAEVDFDATLMRFYGLRRHAPAEQRLLRQIRS